MNWDKWLRRFGHLANLETPLYFLRWRNNSQRGASDMDRINRQHSLSSSLLVDFYHGWMIEVQVGKPDQYDYQCTSSNGVSLNSAILYSHSLQAHQAAIETIALFEACVALRNWVRVAFEAGLVSEDEWYGLTQSLNLATGYHPPTHHDEDYGCWQSEVRV